LPRHAQGNRTSDTSTAPFSAQRGTSNFVPSERDSVSSPPIPSSSPLPLSQFGHRRPCLAGSRRSKRDLCIYVSVFAVEVLVIGQAVWALIRSMDSIDQRSHTDLAVDERARVPVCFTPALDGVRGTSTAVIEGTAT
jgi:hypothetical protein